jgi:hypothetical protein
MPGLSESWTFRSFNPTYAPENHFTARNLQVFTTERDKLELIRAEAVFNLQVTGTTLAGRIEWPGGGLNLNGTFLPGAGASPIRFTITGTGRPDSDTAGWEYLYEGHLTRRWQNGRDQRPALVGSVMRAKTHNGVPPRSPAGEVFSFIAVKEPPFTWELSGSWTYRSFLNDPAYFWERKLNPENLGELILQEAVFKLETPTSTTLQGTTEALGLDLREGTVQSDGEPTSFDIKGFGRPGTNNAGWEFHYHGHLTPRWPKPREASRVDQVPTLVGSVIWAKAQEETPAGYVAPFIAVKR